jgi:hypothetical protein
MDSQPTRMRLAPERRGEIPDTISFPKYDIKTETKMRLGDGHEIPGRIGALEKSGTRRGPRRYFPMIKEDPIAGGGRDQFTPLIVPLDLSNR